MNKKTSAQENLITPSIDSLLNKVENKYVLALLSSKRARELFDGKRPLIKDEYINKVTTAIYEIEAGKVTYKNQLGISFDGESGEGGPETGDEAAAEAEEAFEDDQPE
ncbi:MAG: DNA-directed RNA polymerase subunit omega [Eubacteriaceae bacterium]|jgi:DNA-directed RNA polymerase subunit omega|nr:DNA-directed RNA polymerase subunit omega [Eubacteriaceae bacterium]